MGRDNTLACALPVISILCYTENNIMDERRGVYTCSQMIKLHRKEELDLLQITDVRDCDRSG